MSRRDDLLNYLKGKADENLVENLVDEVVFIEEQLNNIKKLPFIKVHPEHPEIQKATPASKMYVSLMAQYNANIRTLARLSGAVDVEEDSPLRLWAKNHVNK